MSVRPRPVFDLSPLHRPLWWAALALLLVNDNLLKGGGVAPGWLTGKLSDFAFLIVAPVLLAALLPRAVARRRGIALGAVALVYTAADLSPAVSQAIVAGANRIGLPWKLWPDAGDLVALVVLPLTWWLMRPAVATSAPRPTPPARSRPLLESAGVFAGAFACLATSAPPSYQRAPFLVNQTDRPWEVTATWLLRSVPCGTDLAAFAAGLNPGDLDDAHGATLASGDVAVLDRPPAPGQPLSRQCPTDQYHYGYSSSTCVGVVIQASSELSVLAAYPLSWRESDDGSFISCSDDEDRSQCKPRFSLKEDPGPDALSLRERDGKLVLSVGLGSRIQIVEVSPAAIAVRTPSPQACRSLLAEQTQIGSAAAACTADTDCRTASALPFPGRDCVIYGNRSLSAQTLSNLRTRWTQQSCVVDPAYPLSCPPPQPAACLNGRCQEACPGVKLPLCPERCANGTYTGSASCYGSGYVCAQAETWCTCENGKFNCAPPTKMPGCALTCVTFDCTAPPYGDGGTAPTRLPDAGVDAGTPIDAGTGTDAGADTQVDTGQ